MAQTTVSLPSIPETDSSDNQGEENGRVIKLPLSVSNKDSNSPIAAISYSFIHTVPGRLRLRVPNLRHDRLYCQKLQTLLQAEPLITSFRINSSAASLVINYETNAVSEHRMRCNLNNLLFVASQKTTEPTKEIHQEEEKTNASLSLSAVATGLAVLGGSFGLPIPSILIVGSIGVASLPVLQRAMTGIVTQRKLTIDILDFLAIAITTAQGHFLTPALMLSLIEIGEHIRDRTARSSQLQTLDLLSSLGQFVWIEKNGEKVEISIQEVQKGDTVIVYPGELVPVDGTIIKGKALLDEQKLTGESIPIFKTKGQPVFASTLVQEGRIYITVEKTGNNTRAGQSITLMQEAPVHDTRMENYATKVAEKAVLPTLLLGGTVFALSGNAARAASILTLDLATGIRVSIPTAVLAALTYAAKHGVLIRSGRALEKLAQVDTIVFDKTGTLTKGEVEVIGVESFHPEVSQWRVLVLAAAAEQRLTHPVAEAIIRYAENQGVEVPDRNKWNYQLGLGVEATIEGEIVYVGSERFLRQEGVDMSSLPTANEQAESNIYVASNGQLQGKIEYRDVLRTESQAIIHQLLNVASIDVHMLTGDHQRTANAVAAELGISPSHTHAEAFPAHKAAIVQQLHDQGQTVAFVGDGINDSPALAYADVSVSFANGSDIARETADVVLMQNDLYGLLTAIEIAHQAKKLIQQNTTIVAIPNLAALAIAVVFGLNPLAATIVNNGSTIVAGVNGLRPILTASTPTTLPSARRKTLTGRLR
ncbi:cation transporting ATPase [Richelia sinica FACHB-800]|uniref:Cation transporting ATPase n=1 Tax=Richelia sinica FACHB-800 TaxID=1357546 RepID=A0A975T3P3_9NOST|nr:heavy metal translocating P-type ATPase [Richelia sinica]MBD2667027.1 cadmium-translocating P-type ATPase [Richelia sinica FACHB-800]QXE21365.1 cation transporting ATPase [Richelia sinica FACHB-800]